MGMIVTRSASESNLNTDLRKQFTSQPRVLMIAGGVLCVMALIPGFPKIQSIIIGGGAIALGFVLQKNTSIVAEKDLAIEMADNQALSEMEYYKDIDNVYKLLNVEPIEMEFGTA